MWLSLGVAVAWVLAMVLGFWLGQRTARLTSATWTELAIARLKAANSLEESARASLRASDETRRLTERLETMETALQRMDESMGHFAEILVQTGRARVVERQVGEGPGRERRFSREPAPPG